MSGIQFEWVIYYATMGSISLLLSGIFWMLYLRGIFTATAWKIQQKLIKNSKGKANYVCVCVSLIWAEQ